MKSFKNVKLKAIILNLLILVIASISNHCYVFAEELNESIVMSEEFWEQYRGSTAKIYATEEELLQNNLQLSSDMNVINILIENENIELEETGRVCFIDSISLFEDGTYRNIAQEAEWSSDDENVVSAYSGQLIANQAGNTNVHVSYGGITKTINVTVNNSIDVAERVDSILALQEPVSTYSMQQSERNSAVSIASEMVNMAWCPSSNLSGWKGNTTFYAGTTYTGMPYSQTPNQVDKSGFLNSMSASDFYSTYTNSAGIIMPRYGNDCSGFVSFSWSIPRATTQTFLARIKNNTYSAVGSVNYTISEIGGIYSITNYDDVLMMESLKSASQGDALIKVGHTFLVAANSANGGVMYVYEQTPSKARYTSWTYEDLVAGEYIPFSK